MTTRLSKLPKTGAPELFCPNRFRRNRARADLNFQSHDFLFKEVVVSLLDRLNDIKRTFKKILVVGFWDRKYFKTLTDAGYDITFAALHEGTKPFNHSLCMDPEFLPFADNTFDLILHPLSLHWVNDIPGVLTQLNRCLKPDGLVLGALIGGQTLAEVQSCILEAELDSHQSASMHIAPLVDARSMANLMQRAGFALPVVDNDRYKVSYPSYKSLFSDLKGMGERSNLKALYPLSRKVLKSAEALHQKKFSSGNNEIYTHFDIVYFSGWHPHESQQKPKVRGSATLNLADFIS